MSLKETLSVYWVHVQEELLPWLNDTTCGPLNEHHKQLVSVLGMARIETFLPGWSGLPGRPLSERSALARAFVAKAVQQADAISTNISFFISIFLRDTPVCMS